MRPSGSVYVPVRVGPTVVVGRINQPAEGCGGCCLGCGGVLFLLFLVSLVGAATR